MLLYSFQHMLTSIFKLDSYSKHGVWLYTILYKRKIKVKHHMITWAPELMSSDLKAWTIFLNLSLFMRIPWKWNMQQGYGMVVIDAIIEYCFGWDALLKILSKTLFSITLKFIIDNTYGMLTLKNALFRYNWHIINHIYLKCAIQQVLTHVRTCEAITTVKIVNLTLPQSLLMFLGNSALSSLPPPVAKQLFLDLFMVMCINGSSILLLSNSLLMDIRNVSSLAITHIASMNIHVQAFLWPYISSSLEW